MSEGIIIFLASFAIWAMFAGLLVLWIIDGRIKKEVALHAITSAVIAWIVAEMIKSLLPTFRPFQITGLSPLTLTVPSDSAFPSGHAALAFAMAISVWQHDKKLGVFFTLAALGVGIGRILGNVHSPLDIAGGVAIGAVVSILVGRLHVWRLISRG